MTSKQWLLVFVIIATIFSAWTLSIQLDDQGNINTRLDTIERSIVTLQTDNKDLRLENKQLQMDNENLKSLLLKLRQDYEFEKGELGNIKLELSEVKLRLENTEEEIVQLKEQQNFFHDLTREETTNESINSGDSKDTDNPGMNTKAETGNGGQLRKSHGMAQQKKPRIQAPASRNKRLLAQGATDVRNTEYKVSFSAHMSSTKHNLGDDQALVFETVNNNEGGAYDKTTGVFVCPVNGTYYFTAHILSVYQQSIWAEMVFNGAIKSMLYAGGSTGVHGAGSNSLIIHCAKNDHVWMRHHNSHGTEILGGLYSHFAGFLLWTDSSYMSNTGVIVG